jgi:DNA-binding CsgD family transcriptional regulator
LQRFWTAYQAPSCSSIRSVGWFRPIGARANIWRQERCYESRGAFCGCTIGKPPLRWTKPFLWQRRQRLLRASKSSPFRCDSGDRYLASILPLTSGAGSEIGSRRRAVAAVFVRRIGLDLRLDPVPVARSYDLTPRELTVMTTVVESSGVPEAAAILGLSQNTVRSHLQSIYRKTGAKNQSELSRLVASAGTGLR